LTQRPDYILLTVEDHAVLQLIKKVGCVPPACATYLRPPKRGLRVGGSRSGEGRAIPPYKLQKTKEIHIRKGGLDMAAEEIKVYSTPT